MWIRRVSEDSDHTEDHEEENEGSDEEDVSVVHSRMSKRRTRTRRMRFAKGNGRRMRFVGEVTGLPSSSPFLLPSSS